MGGPDTTVPAIPTQHESSHAGDALRNAACRCAPPRELLEEFLQAFARYVKSRRLYPPGHSRPLKHLQAWIDAAARVLDRHPEITLYVEPEHLHLSGESFGERNRLAHDLIPALLRRLIRYVVIRKGITAEELQALTEPLLLDPEILAQEGGPRAVVARTATPHLTLVEFSFDMDSFAETERDVDLVYRLGRLEPGDAGEIEVLRQLTSREITHEERQLVAALLQSPAITEKLAAVSRCFVPDGGDRQIDMGASELFLLLVRGLAAGDADAAAPTPELVEHMLDRLTERLQAAVAKPASQGEPGLFEELAVRMLTSPKAFTHWLAEDCAEEAVSQATPSADALKVIFSRSGSGERTFKFGDATLTMQQAVGAPAPSVQARTGGGASRGGLSLADIAEKVRQLAVNLCGARLALSPVKVIFAHRDTLLELLAGEDDEAARRRIVTGLRAFLAAQVRRDPALAETLLLAVEKDAHGRLEPIERELLLDAPEVCARALKRTVVDGVTFWSDALEAVGQTARAAYAAALGALLLSEQGDVPSDVLRRHIPACQDELLKWFKQRLAEKDPPVERITALALHCSGPEMVPLIERLLGLVKDDERQKLFCRLVEIDDAPSLAVIAAQIKTLSGPVLTHVLRLLGYSECPFAEDILLDVLHRMEAGAGDGADACRQAIVASLARVGTEKSAAALKRLGGGWLGRMRRDGRVMRQRVRAALDAVRARSRGGH